MIKINSNVLQSVVSTMSKSIKDSGIGERNVYIKAVNESMVSLYFTSLHLSLEKRVPAAITDPTFFITTSIKELDLKVGVLPRDVEVEVKHVKKGSGQHLELLWGTNGRHNGMTVAVLNEETEFIEVPMAFEKVKWGPKVLSHLVSKMKGFTAVSGRSLPIFSGISISRTSIGKCVLRATDQQNSVTYVSKEYDWLEQEVVLDRDYLQAIAGLIPTNTDLEVGINENASLVIFQTSDSTCVCRVTEGLFPDLDILYDHNVECKYYFDRQELLEICSRVTKILDTGTKTVRFEIRKNVVFAVVPGVLEQQLGATVEGIKWNFAISAKNLFECVKFFEGQDEVILYLKGPGKTITIGSDEDLDVKISSTPIPLTGLNHESVEAVRM